MTVCPCLTAAPSPGSAKVRVTFVPLTATPPTPMHAPSSAVTAKRDLAGAPAGVASSSSLKAIVSELPVVATRAEAGTGATMSTLVALASSSDSENGPLP